MKSALRLRVGFAAHTSDSAKAEPSPEGGIRRFWLIDAGRLAPRAAVLREGDGGTAGRSPSHQRFRQSGTIS